MLFHALYHKDFSELQSITFQSKVVSSQAPNAAWRAILPQILPMPFLPISLKQNVKIQAHHFLEPLWITLKCIFSRIKLKFRSTPNKYCKTIIYSITNRILRAKKKPRENIQENKNTKLPLIRASPNHNKKALGKNLFLIIFSLWIAQKVCSRKNVEQLVRNKKAAGFVWFRGLVRHFEVRHLCFFHICDCKYIIYLKLAEGRNLTHPIDRKVDIRRKKTIYF